ncbi:MULTISPECIES: hypothetical protein [unclassified Streptococcus]|uniref:hypothetical protein n=1 Tax=unclassified Streptococcus TaxID=2608887 RepID=UPI0010229C97|nr:MULTISPECIES: hypothetical protein [unclassified Streptococcus]MTQ41876.1 hypothetical protein [Streptococcus sp. BIOML-A1]RYS61130.1 hypothetical protein EAI95_04145 [Streptococcus sp. bf_0095]
MVEKEWRFCSSEDDGDWVILSDSDRAETKEDIHSINQKESVMRMYRRPGDFVSVSLLSASYEIDDVTGKLGQERDFYLKIECLQDGWASISSQVYKKEEAVTLASLFIGLRKDAAIKLWKIKKLGEKNLGDRIEK